VALEAGGSSPLMQKPFIKQISGKSSIHRLSSLPTFPKPFLDLPTVCFTKCVLAKNLRISLPSPSPLPNEVHRTIQPIVVLISLL
jgi:hypothetical protein